VENRFNSKLDNLVGGLSSTYSGGGDGVGDPLDRDIEQVKWDAVNDYVSIGSYRGVGEMK
jgi:N-methylhydantoinase B/oxoprolinase/acetone carboxylase alpha subunit